MLSNPFKTTRKMKVPFKSRVGHQERVFLKFARFAIGLGVGLLLLYFIVQVLGVYGVG
jgi:hypothetical protein